MGIFDVFGEIGQEFQAIVQAETAYQNGIQTSQPASTSGGGGNGYHFTPDEMQSVLSDWQGLQAKIQGAMNNAHPMSTAVAPGKESASDTAVSAVNQSGQAYMDHLKAMNEYAGKYISALQAALTNYQNAEESGQASAKAVQTQL
jgi:hypothetical protein